MSISNPNAWRHVVQHDVTSAFALDAIDVSSGHVWKPNRRGLLWQCTEVNKTCAVSADLVLIVTMVIMNSHASFIFLLRRRIRMHKTTTFGAWLVLLTSASS